jgi:hypothetical protein
LRDASPIKENKSGDASYLSISSRRLPGISTDTRIQVLSLRANDLCFRAGSAIDDGTAMRQRLPNRRPAEHSKYPRPKMAAMSKSSA